MEIRKTRSKIIILLISVIMVISFNCFSFAEDSRLSSDDGAAGGSPIPVSSVTTNDPLGNSSTPASSVQSPLDTIALGDNSSNLLFNLLFSFLLLFLMLPLILLKKSSLMTPPTSNTGGAYSNSYSSSGGGSSSGSSSSNSSGSSSGSSGGSGSGGSGSGDSRGGGGSCGGSRGGGSFGGDTSCGGSRGGGGSCGGSRGSGGNHRQDDDSSGWDESAGADGDEDQSADGDEDQSADGDEDQSADTAGAESSTAASGDGSGSDIVAEAEKYIGQDNDDEKFGSDPIGWCVLFVEYVVKNVRGNIPWEEYSSRFEADKAVYEWGKDNGKLITDVKQAKPGDILVRNYDVGGEGAHTCIVQSVNESDGTLNIVEGNNGESKVGYGEYPFDPSTDGIISMS